MQFQVVINNKKDANPLDDIIEWQSNHNPPPINNSKKIPLSPRKDKNTHINDKKKLSIKTRLHLHQNQEQQEDIQNQNSSQSKNQQQRHTVHFQPSNLQQISPQEQKSNTRMNLSNVEQRSKIYNQEKIEQQKYNSKHLRQNINNKRRKSVIENFSGKNLPNKIEKLQKKLKQKSIDSNCKIQRKSTLGNQMMNSSQCKNNLANIQKKKKSEFDAIGKFRSTIKSILIINKFYNTLKEKAENQYQSGLYRKQKDKKNVFIHKRRCFLPFYPTDKFKQMWNISLILMLIFTALITPIRVCFIEDQDADDWFAIDMFFDAYFGLDIIVNFLSAYVNQQSKLIIDWKQIFINYLTGWFPIDLIAIFPFDYAFSSISNGSQQYNKLFRLLRLPRLYRLTKLVKLSKGGSDSIISKILEVFQMNIGVRKMMNIITMMLIMNHFAASIWFFISRLDDYNEFTWVARFEYVNASYFEKYIASFYWAFQTLTTVGYGDIPSITVYEQIFALFWMIVGVGFYSFTIGNLSGLLLEMNQQGALFNSTNEQIDDISTKCNIPENIQQKVYKLFEINYKENMFFGFDYDMFSQDIYYAHREEIALLIYQGLINQINLLKYDLSFSSQLVPNLYYMKVLKDEVIYRQLDPSEEIFFIIKGQVALTNENGAILLQINDSFYFGEEEILEEERRKHFAIAKQDTVLLFCKKEIFLRILESYQNVIELFQRKILIRQKKINHAIKQFNLYNLKLIQLSSIMKNSLNISNYTQQAIKLQKQFQISFLEKSSMETIYNQYSQKTKQMFGLKQSDFNQIFNSNIHYMYFLEGIQKDDKKKNQQEENNQQQSNKKITQVLPQTIDMEQQDQQQKQIGEIEKNSSQTTGLEILNSKHKQSIYNNQYGQQTNNTNNITLDTQQNLINSPKNYFQSNMFAKNQYQEQDQYFQGQINQQATIESQQIQTYTQDEQFSSQNSLSQIQQLQKTQNKSPSQIQEDYLLSLSLQQKHIQKLSNNQLFDKSDQKQFPNQVIQPQINNIKNNQQQPFSPALRKSRKETTIRPKYKITSKQISEIKKSQNLLLMQGLNRSDSIDSRSKSQRPPQNVGFIDLQQQQQYYIKTQSVEDQNLKQQQNQINTQNDNNNNKDQNNNEEYIQTNNNQQNQQKSTKRNQKKHYSTQIVLNQQDNQQISNKEKKQVNEYLKMENTLLNLEINEKNIDLDKRHSMNSSDPQSNKRLSLIQQQRKNSDLTESKKQLKQFLQKGITLDNENQIEQQDQQFYDDEVIQDPQQQNQQQKFKRGKSISGGTIITELNTTQQDKQIEKEIEYMKKIKERRSTSHVINSQLAVIKYKKIMQNLDEIRNLSTEYREIRFQVMKLINQVQNQHDELNQIQLRSNKPRKNTLTIRQIQTNKKL